MSSQTRFRSPLDQNTMSRQQEEYIRQLQAKKQSLQQATTQKYKSMLQNCYQMQEMGTNINVNLKGQTQQLQNIHSVSNDMKKILKKADETSKEMASFWYSIGKKIKKVFVKDKDDDFETDTQSKSTKNETKGSLSGQEKAAFVKCQTSTTKDTPSQQQNIDDMYLDELTSQLKKLKGLSRQTNQQLTKQSHLINDLDKKTDANSNKIEQIDKRIKKKFF